MNTRVEDQQASATPLFRLKVALAFFAFIMIGANDGAFGILLPGIGSHYHVDKATLGLLFLCSTTGYLIGSFNNGFLIERLGNQRFLMLGTAAFMLGVGTISLTPPFLVILPAFLILGLGISIIDPGLNSFVAGLPRNTTLLNYLHAFYGVGAWLGPIFATQVLAWQWGWNRVYSAWLVIGLIILLGFLFIFREQSIARVDRAAQEGNILSMTLRLRVVWIAAFFLFFYVGAEVSVGSWSYSLLVEGRHGPAVLSGWIVSGYWLGLTLGRVALIPVALRMGEKRLIQGCLAGVVVGLLLIWLIPMQAVAAAGLFLVGFSFGPLFPTIIALMPRMVAARILPGAIGFLASLGSGGGALFPWLAGNLAQYAGLQVLLPFVIALTVVMQLLWWAFKRSQPQL